MHGKLYTYVCSGHFQCCVNCCRNIRILELTLQEKTLAFRTIYVLATGNLPISQRQGIIRLIPKKECSNRVHYYILIPKLIRTDLGRQITCLFFSSVEYLVSSFCVEFSLEPFSNLVYACAWHLGNRKSNQHYTQSRKLRNDFIYYFIRSYFPAFVLQ